MIPWDQLDDHERAVWSATVATHFIVKWELSSNPTDESAIRFATNLADRAVYALREQAKKGA